MAENVCFTISTKVDHCDDRRIHTHTHITYIHIHTHTHTHAHTYAHIHIHTHTHARTPSLGTQPDPRTTAHALLAVSGIAVAWMNTRVVVRQHHLKGHADITSLWLHTRASSTFFIKKIYICVLHTHPAHAARPTYHSIFTTFGFRASACLDEHTSGCASTSSKRPRRHKLTMAAYTSEQHFFHLKQYLCYAHQA